jgi:hypothetical protein
MNMQVLDARRDVGGGYKVDVSQGSRVGRVSSEWFLRPDDERFLSLNELASAVRGGTVSNFVCGRAVEHYAAMALMNRSPKMTAN